MADLYKTDRTLILVRSFLVGQGRRGGEAGDGRREGGQRAVLIDSRRHTSLGNTTRPDGMTAQSPLASSAHLCLSACACFKSCQILPASKRTKHLERSCSSREAVPLTPNVFQISTGSSMKTGVMTTIAQKDFSGTASLEMFGVSEYGREKVWVCVCVCSCVCVCAREC